MYCTSLNLFSRQKLMNFKRVITSIACLHEIVFQYNSDDDDEASYFYSGPLIRLENSPRPKHCDLLYLPGQSKHCDLPGRDGWD